MKYRVINVLTLYAGTLILSKDQAEARAPALSPADAMGAYTVTSRVQFKVGEEIGFLGEAPKDVLPHLGSVGGKAAGKGGKKKGEDGKQGGSGGKAGVNGEGGDDGKPHVGEGAGAGA